MISGTMTNKELANELASYIDEIEGDLDPRPTPTSGIVTYGVLGGREVRVTLEVL